MRAQPLLSAVCLTLAAFGTAHARHSVSGSFDSNRNVEITGEVVERGRGPEGLRRG
jgi:hypothetical protein